jgi:hypothetical protein
VSSSWSPPPAAAAVLSAVAEKNHTSLERRQMALVNYKVSIRNCFFVHTSRMLPATEQLRKCKLKMLQNCDCKLSKLNICNSATLSLCCGAGSRFGSEILCLSRARPGAKNNIGSCLAQDPNSGGNNYLPF